MPASTFLPTFSVCVCTRDNPEGLRQTLQSIFDSTMPAHEILVSDDSSNYETRQLMQHAYAGIRYLEGPRRTPAANRNRAFQAVTGSHVLFLDDDCRLGPTFLQQMCERIADDFIYRVAAGGDPECMIVTGTGICAGQQLWPHRSTFLGYPSTAYRRGEPLCSVLLFSTVFPAEILRKLHFDEQLSNGYDVADFANRAVFGHHCHIELLPSAQNLQTAQRKTEPSGPATDAARIYTMLRRYQHGHRRRLNAALFLLLALEQSLVRQLQHSGVHGFATFLATMRVLRSYRQGHVDILGR